MMGEARQHERDSRAMMEGSGRRGLGRVVAHDRHDHWGVRKGRWCSSGEGDCDCDPRADSGQTLLGGAV